MKGTLSPRAVEELHSFASDVASFARHFCGVELRPYQLEAAQAILRSVFARDGRSFVILFSRQSGKDELLAILMLFLMLRFIEHGTEIVCAQPTFKPQTVNAMERLIKRGQLFGKRLRRTAGYILRLGQARITYYSAEKRASQVGATADRLLILNEAQDIPAAIYDKRFSPMTASGHATRVFSGTSWTSQTLLAREKRSASEAEKQDGVKRVFIVDADQVGALNPLYARHVQEEISKLGRDHPFIRTQYYCQEVDAQSGMFHTGRLALMFAAGVEDKGAVSRRGTIDRALTGGAIAFLIDVAGQDEARMKLNDDAPLTNPGRDSTALSIVQVDTSTLATLQAPTYRVVERVQWTGLNHLTVFGQIKALAEKWNPLKMVVDATGVGEGLWGMLDRAYPNRVIRVKFTREEKSEIGWGFLAVIETGRFRIECQSELAREQYAACQSEILPGSGKVLRWGVPEGYRGSTGLTLHDDLVMADALVAVLDREKWAAPTKSGFVQPTYDPIKAIEGHF